MVPVLGRDRHAGVRRGDGVATFSDYQERSYKPRPAACHGDRVDTVRVRPTTTPAAPTSHRIGPDGLKIEKEPPTSLCDGDESRRWREGILRF